MEWLLDSTLRICRVVITSASYYLLLPIAKCAVWCTIYTIGSVVLKIFLNLRYEIFNEDLKYTLADCASKVVLVTGATSGIGLSLAHYFYDKEFIVIASFFSKEEPGYKELECLTNVSAANKQRMHLVELDVRSSDSIEACYGQVKALLKDNPDYKMHALINVAGIGCYYRFHWMPRELIKNMVNTNLLGPILMTRQFLHLLLRNPGSRVINVASPMAFLPTELASVYGATKAGITQFTNALEMEAIRYGIKTVTVHPGNIVRNTSILNTSIKDNLDRVKSELNDDELALYKTELDIHLVEMKKLKRIFQKPINLKLERGASLISNVMTIVRLVGGSLEETKLHESSSFMKNFDNSVRMKNPPKEMYAGNRLFNIVISAIFETLSRALCRDITLMIRRKNFAIFV